MFVAAANAPVDAECATGLHPDAWPWAKLSPPVVSSEHTSWRGALLRRWRGTSSQMDQPPLDHHYIAIHLDGPKHVARRRDGPSVATIADRGSLTIVPAGTAYSWHTRGPIAFAHVYLRPSQFEDAAAAALDIDPRSVALTDRVACRDPLLEALFERMMGEVDAGADASALVLDSLLETFLAQLARHHGSRPDAGKGRRPTLTPQAMGRVLEFIRSHLGSEIFLADLSWAAGVSASHFSHAFRAATGESPYGYVQRRRVESAQRLLLGDGDSLKAIGEQCGFSTTRQFAIAFRKIVGVGPKQFRLDRR